MLKVKLQKTIVKELEQAIFGNDDSKEKIDSKER